MQPGFIYLLESKKYNKKYLGSTNNPTTRIERHNNGWSKATKNYIPWTCLMVLRVENLEIARKIEYYIKRHKEKLSVPEVVKIIARYYHSKEKSTPV